LWALGDSKPEKIAKELPSEWQIIEIKADGRNYTIGDNDFLKIPPEGNVFSINIQNEDIEKSGVWSLTDKLLTLVYDLEDISVHIDSVMYNVEDHMPELMFYSEGIRITGYVNNRLVSEAEVERFEIVECNSDSLVLKNDTKTIICIRDTDEPIMALVDEGGFGMKSLLRGLLGLIVILGIAYLFSTNRKAISWRLVGFGLLTQITIAILVLKVPFMQSVFAFLGKVFVKILNFSNIGGDFLFESFITGKVEIALINFAFQILPTIIFFSALTSILFYYGIIQKVVYVLAWFLTKLLRISGAESLSATGNRLFRIDLVSVVSGIRYQVSSIKYKDFDD